MEGFNIGTMDHWALCAANLQKLSTFMENYLEFVLKLPVDKEYINIQAIVRKNDRFQLLRLCERALGIVGNSKAREKFIDPILKLEESHQAILMEIMLKYVKSEESRKTIKAMENELVESLQIQLKDKEAERHGFIEHIGKLETENKELSKSILEIDAKCKSLEKDNQALRAFIDEESQKRLNYIPKFEVESPTNSNLEDEIFKLNKQVKSLQEEIKELKSNYSEEKSKLQDELFVANQKANKVPTLEKQIEQQAAQIENLKNAELEQKSLITRIELYEIKIQELEKNKKQLVEECKKVSTQLYSEQNEYKSIIEDSKKYNEKIKKMEDEYSSLDEKKKHWEQRAKQAEEKLKKMSEEIDSLKLSVNAGNLLTQEQELKYKQKIERLEEQVELLSETSNTKLATKLADLEGKLEAITNVKIKNEQELILINKRYEELLKEHQNSLEEIENYKLDKSNTIDLSKEYSRVKKDRDTLLELAGKTQDLSQKFEEMKIEYEKLKNDHKNVQEKLNADLSEKANFEEKIKDLSEKKLELEKNEARMEEKLRVLQEERKKSEEFIKEIIQKAENVFW